jgi:hypothetical protein
MEPLHRILSLAADDGVLSRLRGRANDVRTSLYADDAVFFVNPVKAELEAVRDILSRFGEVTGLHVNFAKTAVIPISCEGLDVADIVSPLGARIASLPCKFLGLPLSLRKLRKVDFQPLLDRIASRLACWKAKLLSAAGRLVLLNAVLSALSTYWISIHSLPAWVRKEIDRLGRAWLWRGDDTCHGGHCKMAWSRICRPRDLGGLGIVDLDRFGAALRLKWLWRERVAPDRPWVGMPVPCSTAEREIFAAATTVALGDGLTARFWFDSWMDGQAPFALMPGLFTASRRKQRSVREALLNGRWVQDLRGRVSPALLPDFVRLWLAAERVHLTPGEPDCFTWLLSDSGSYSAASAYRLQFLGSTESPLVTSIWDAWAPAKYRLLAWLMVQNRVLTADRLMARQWPNSYFCPLCWRNLETAEHLLVECPWSRNLWTLVASRFGLASLRPGTCSPGPLSAWLASLAAAAPTEIKACKSIALLVIWAIWRERNDRIFRARERRPEEVLGDIIDERSCWALAGCRHLRVRE